MPLFGTSKLFFSLLVKPSSSSLRTDGSFRVSSKTEGHTGTFGANWEFHRGREFVVPVSMSKEMSTGSEAQSRLEMKFGVSWGCQRWLEAVRYCLSSGSLENET